MSPERFAPQAPRRAVSKAAPVSLPFHASPLLGALSERGYAELTPVQSAVLEEGARGRDLLVSAQTGSGKTVAYGLVIGETLLAGADELDRPERPMALVVAPTRELALQVERELVWLFAKSGGRVVACVGGMDPRAERRRLELGAHIVVGTPGRLKDHIDRRALDVSALKVVVLDEADEMLDLGFREDLEFILEATPSERRTLLFSATLPAAIVSIARRFQRDAARIETSGAVRGHADIEHRAIRISPREVGAVVVNVLRKYDAPAALVFCATRDAVRRLHATLAERGFPAVLISGELGQAERNRALQDLRDGRARVCVATDVAARGIDLPSLTLVIHADLPHDAEIFQHRSGRTGRAGRKGVSILLAPASRRRKAELLFADAGVTPVWDGPPSAQEIEALDQERLFADPVFTEAPTEDDLALARLLSARKSPEEIAVALARLQRARLPAAEDVEDPVERFATRTRPEFSERGPRDRGFADQPDRSADAVPVPRRGQMGPSVWFRLAVGRKQNADPKWLLPMICRRGGVTSDAIGAIRIFDAETKVQIAAEAAEGFAASALKNIKGDVAFTLADTAGNPSRAARPAPADRLAPPKRHATAPTEARKPHDRKRKEFSERSAGKPKAGAKPGAKPGAYAAKAKRPPAFKHGGR